MTQKLLVPRRLRRRRPHAGQPGRDRRRLECTWSPVDSSIGARVVPHPSHASIARCREDPSDRDRDRRVGAAARRSARMNDAIRAASPRSTEPPSRRAAIVAWPPILAPSVPGASSRRASSVERSSVERRAKPNRNPLRKCASSAFTGSRGPWMRNGRLSHRGIARYTPLSRALWGPSRRCSAASQAALPLYAWLLERGVDGHRARERVEQSSRAVLAMARAAFSEALRYDKSHGFELGGEISWQPDTYPVKMRKG